MKAEQDWTIEDRPVTGMCEVCGALGVKVVLTHNPYLHALADTDAERVVVENDEVWWCYACHAEEAANV
jgi:hypothetical protein